MIKWTIRREPYSIGYQVMKITKETPYMVYGSVNGIGTHSKPIDCLGRYDSEIEAASRVKAVAKVFADHERLIKDARAVMELRERDCDEAVKAVIDG